MFPLTAKAIRVLAIATTICILQSGVERSYAQEKSKSYPAAASRKAMGAGAKKTQPVLSDEALQRAINTRFAASKIAVNGFTVSVSGGRATLRGTAGVAQHKGVATRLAKAAGAREVVNQIVVSDKGRDRLRHKAASKGDGKPRGSAPGRPTEREEATPATKQAPRSTSTATQVERGKETASKSNLDASKSTGTELKRFRVIGPASHKHGKPGDLRRY